jgi:F5/8 type C domain-containing protein
MSLSVKSVTASGYETGTTNYPQNVIDNNFSTRWSNYGIGSWIKLDLGSVFSVNEVDIAWYNGNTRVNNFVIDISSDNSTWNTVFSGKSSGTTTNYESYKFSTASGRYVRVTVNGNTSNDWASITEVKVIGASSPPPPSPPPTTNTDINGVTMLYPSNTNGPSYFYNMADNIQSSKYINTDGNTATQMTQNNITFKRLTSTNVTYSTGTGKTCRVNLNAGGFVSTQAHTWENTTGYIWTPADSKNVEFTYYFRVDNFVQEHTECSSKLRGGIHTGSNDPRASCIQTNFFIGGGHTQTESAYEYNHPDYSFSSITPIIPNTAQAGKWIGRKTICWNGSDGKVHTIDYIDWNPFDANGKPLNNWQKFFTQTFAGTSSNGYTKAPTWGGMMTFRMDGYQYVDISIISVREIIPPS